MSNTPFAALPGLAAPARRALAAAGYEYAEQLVNAREKELARLHGMGPNALKVLRLFLASKDLDFKKP